MNTNDSVIVPHFIIIVKLLVEYIYLKFNFYLILILSLYVSGI